jgi:hypothetical protein
MSKIPSTITEGMQVWLELALRQLAGWDMLAIVIRPLSLDQRRAPSVKRTQAGKPDTVQARLQKTQLAKLSVLIRVGSVYMN